MPRMKGSLRLQLNDGTRIIDKDSLEKFFGVPMDTILEHIK